MAHLADEAQRVADVAATVVVAVVVALASPVKAFRLTATMPATVDAHLLNVLRRVDAVVPLAVQAVDSAAAMLATKGMAAVTTSSPAIFATMLAAT